MSSPQQLLEAIQGLQLPGVLRILHLSGDQERVLIRAGIREQLPAGIEVRAGPGCAASVCPGSDVYQAIQLVQRHAVALMIDESLLHLPTGGDAAGPVSLAEARAQGADVRVIDAPVEAFMTARAEPDREVVLFVAGFETLLVPLAGLLLEGLPENLSLLLCGRDVAPLLRQRLEDEDPGFEALLLPGNRCAVLGSDRWEHLAGGRRLPAAVTGYTAAAVLRAIHAVARQFSEGDARVENCYQPIARREGNAAAKEWLQRVYARTDGHWRGYGEVADSAYRLADSYREHDADNRYPDYRAAASADDLPAGCHCGSVMLGTERPSDCPGFGSICSGRQPYGPCMAALDGTCRVNDMLRA